MKKVLIVAYGFPPVGGAGVQRPVKFVKYLPHFGWLPTVLTVDKPSVPVSDQTLTTDIPPGVKIIRARTYEPSYATKISFSRRPKNGSRVPSLRGIVKKIASLFLLPDLQTLWWPHLFIEMFRSAKSEQPACILVTAPPFSSFVPVTLIGRMFNIPVVLDYRDEWGFARENLENSNKGKWAKYIDRIMERYVVRSCAGITATNASYISGLQESYLKGASKKSSVITNGYDDDDFRHLSSPSSAPLKVRIIYTGTVWRATSLKNIISAYCALFRQGDVPKFTIDVYGRVVDQELTYLTSPQVAEFLTIHGYVEHEEIVRHMHDADVLLLSLSDLPGSHKIITGKIFEYMATGKHIFAVIPEGETRAIIENDYDNRTIVDPNNVDDISNKAASILSHIGALRGKQGICPEKYRRFNLTKKLATFLDEIICT